MESIIIILVILIMLYLLYEMGYVGYTTKAAVVFIGSMPKKTSWKAKFSSCSGHMHRVIRFSECKRYEFTLNAEIEKGEFVVEIYDSHKQLILSLDSVNSTGYVEVEDSKKFYMSVKMKSCTGSYYVRWE